MSSNFEMDLTTTESLEVEALPPPAKRTSPQMANGSRFRKKDSMRKWVVLTNYILFHFSIFLSPLSFLTIPFTYS